MSGTGLRRKKSLKDQLSIRASLRMPWLGASACRDKPQDADCVVGRHGKAAFRGRARRGNCSYTLPLLSWRISRTIRRMLRGVGLISSPSKNFTHSILFKTRLKRPINDSFGVQIEVVDSQNLCLLRKTSRRPSRRRLSMMAAPVRQASGSPRQDVSARVNGTCFGHEPLALAVRRASVV